MGNQQQTVAEEEAERAVARFCRDHLFDRVLDRLQT
jgi:hypothetical protein